MTDTFKPGDVVEMIEIVSPDSRAPDRWIPATVRALLEPGLYLVHADPFGGLHNVLAASLRRAAFEVSTDDEDQTAIFPTLAEARAHARGLEKTQPREGYAIWRGTVDGAGDFSTAVRVEFYEPHPDDFAPQDDSPSLDDHPWSIFQADERE